MKNGAPTDVRAGYSKFGSVGVNSKSSRATLQNGKSPRVRKQWLLNLNGALIAHAHSRGFNVSQTATE